MQPYSTDVVLAIMLDNNNSYLQGAPYAATILPRPSALGEIFQPGHLASLVISYMVHRSTGYCCIYQSYVSLKASLTLLHLLSHISIISKTSSPLTLASRLVGSMSIPHTPHWLDQYGDPEVHAWKTAITDGQTKLYRPLGLVEYAFDSDGRYHEGRADLNVQLDLTVKTLLGKEELRERIVLAWALFQCEHPLAQSRALERQSYMDEPKVATPPVYSVVDVPEDESAAIDNARANLVFLEDHFNDVDPLDFWLHAQNAARVVVPEQSLAKCFVFPFKLDENGSGTLRFLNVIGHQVTDGLTNYTWMRSFVHILNKPAADLHAALQANITPSALLSHLPPPQESLYPLITGSKARQRWFWALTRILRHVRKPHRAGFPNPLRRAVPLAPSHLPPTYASLLDYSRLPPLNTVPVFAKASLLATARLTTLCRSASVSVGAGCFALAALLMMEFHERLEPSIPLSERRPFITGFPLNPRPFLSTPVQAESLMLAFSDGIELPFLPSHLPLDSRIKLLAKRAQKQLAVYQKRPVEQLGSQAEKLYYMGSRGPGRMLQTQYISSIERTQAILPPSLRKRQGQPPSPQGAYPMRPNATTQTCGVSSVGRRDGLIGRGMYDVHSTLLSDAEGGKDFVADFSDIHACVRVRDGEFLIGVGGADDGLWLAVSADATNLDPVLMGEWKERLEEAFGELEREEMEMVKGPSL